MHSDRRKISVARLSVLSNSVLVAGKLVVGLTIGSVSVISEAIHSGVDLLAALIALFSVSVSGRPPDREHPWGHGKIENISGAVEAVLIFGAAGWIVYEAVHRLISGEPMQHAAWGVAVMAVSASANWVVSRMLFKVGRETDSIALQADAWHLRTDVWTSAGVMGGLALIAVGEALQARGWLPGFPLQWIDPVAAIAVALLIVKAAWQLTAQSLRDVLDTSLPDDEVEWIRSHVAEEPGVRGVHDLRTRKSGAQRFVEFHVMVDGAMSTALSHRLTDALVAKIRARFPDASVTSHVEPCDGECPPECLAGCVLGPEQRRAAQAEHDAA